MWVFLEVFTSSCEIFISIFETFWLIETELSDIFSEEWVIWRRRRWPWRRPWRGRPAWPPLTRSRHPAHPAPAAPTPPSYRRRSRASGRESLGLQKLGFSRKFDVFAEVGGFPGNLGVFSETWEFSRKLEVFTETWSFYGNLKFSQKLEVFSEILSFLQKKVRACPALLFGLKLFLKSRQSKFLYFINRKR